jgi:hypothetical protein
MTRTVLLLLLLFSPLFARGQASGPPSGGHFMLGAGFGTPSGVGVIAGYDLGPVALRASGGAWEKGWFGLQGDVAVHFATGPSFAHGLSLIAGRYGNDPAEPQGGRTYTTENFLGLAYEAELAGFIIEAGVAYGKGDYPGAFGIYQVGYLFTF